MGAPITVMIVEDNADLRDTVVALLTAEADIDCIAETSELGQVTALATATSPNVIILDIELQGQSSLLRLPALRRELPAARFLVYSGHSLPALVEAALAAGAAGYVLKSGDPDELIQAVRRCARS